MAYGPVDGRRRLEQSCIPAIHPYLRRGGRAARCDWRDSQLASRADLDLRASPGGQRLARGAGSDDVIGNRLYLAWGVGDDGILPIVDRTKLLPHSLGGTWTGDPDRPTNEDLEGAQAGILYMSPNQGGHATRPVFGPTR